LANHKQNEGEAMIPTLFAATLLFAFSLAVALMAMHWLICRKLRRTDMDLAYRFGVDATAFGSMAYKLTYYLLFLGNTLPGMGRMLSWYRWLNYIYILAVVFLVVLFCLLIRTARGI
jgi:hypothetical protein